MSTDTSLTDCPAPGTLHDIADGLESGDLSSVDLCRTYLERSESVDSTINGFRTLDTDSILQLAEESDKRRKAGNALGRFDGVPIAVKDNISVEGDTCGCSSKILERYTALYDATVSARIKAGGSICFGRTNMDEFAMGSSTENSAYESTRNPWNTDCVPGGSSGGSAAVVASGQVPAALGSDTGGSIRQPASFCGTVGLKPTYGRISRFGLVAFASSLDQIGPLTSDVQDAAILLDMIGGHDPKDSTSLDMDCDGFEAALSDIDPSSIRVGVPREYFDVSGLDDDVRKQIESAIAFYKDAGCTIVDVSFPNLSHCVAVYYIIATAEASSNLARFDGIRYGNRYHEADSLMDTYLETRERGFGDEVKRRILLGTYVLSSGYYDAYYLRAQKARTLIRNDFKSVFEQCDVIASPVAPTPAFGIDAIKDPLQMYLEDIYTIPVNLAGNCAISVPAGQSADGLPIGLQLIGDSLNERAILQAAQLFEKGTQ